MISAVYKVLPPVCLRSQFICRAVNYCGQRAACLCNGGQPEDAKTGFFFKSNDEMPTTRRVYAYWRWGRFEVSAAGVSPEARRRRCARYTR